MFTLCLKNALCNIRSNHPSVMLVGLISIIYNMQLHASPILRGRQFSEDLRAGKLGWKNCARAEKMAFSRLPFSPPTRSSPALIFPPASPPPKKPSARQAMHSQVQVCNMFGQDRQNTNSEISSPFLQQQVGFLKYQIHFTKVIS